MSKAPAPIIKKVKKGGHGGHHGGAWKVAYADFVTAMMAFFLLLWLLAATPAENLKGLADYFSPTQGLKGRMGIGFRGGLAPAKEGVSANEWASQGVVFGAPPAGPSQKKMDALESSGDGGDKSDAESFSILQTDLEKSIARSGELQELRDSMNVEVTPEGLQIEVMDKDNKPMFKPSTDEMHPHAKVLLAAITEAIKYLPNYISITGHTNSIRYSGIRKDYGNWELSADRANATRRFMVESGLDEEQVIRIVGKADTEPKDINDPLSPGNRRVTIVLLKQSVLPYQKKVVPDQLLYNPEKTNVEEYLAIKPKEEKKDSHAESSGKPSKQLPVLDLIDVEHDTVPAKDSKPRENEPVVPKSFLEKH